MNLARITALAASAILLAACSSTLPVQQAPVNIIFKQLEEAPQPRGNSSVEVRARAKVDKKTKEVAGARCMLDTPYFSTNEFSTPAIVNVPTYGHSSSELVFTCSYNGVTRIARSVAYSAQNARTRQSFSSTGLVGAIVGEAIIAGRDQSDHTFTYSNVMVDFTK